MNAAPASPELLLKLNVFGINYTFQQRSNTPCLGFRSIPTLKSSRRRNLYDERLTARRNISNLVPVQCVDVPTPRSNIKFGVWNAQSINKKSGSICDLIISKHLDILSITETWISGNAYDNNTIAEVLNTLKDFQFHDLSGLNRTGGGVGIFLRKGFTIHTRDCIPFTSMEIS